MDQEREIGSAAQAAADMAREDRERRQRAESQAGSGRSLDSPALAVGLTLVLVILTALNLTGNGLLPRTQEPSEAQEIWSLEEELDLLGLEIEAEMELTGEVPEEIDYLVPPVFDTWSYVKLAADRYRLSLTVDGRTLRTESRADF